MQIAYMAAAAAACICIHSSNSAQTVIPSDAYTQPKRLVAVERGRRLNLFCQGRGAPVVLFDSGLGDSSVVWRFVQGQVAKTTRACAYDRAGYGFSDPSTSPSDVTAIVADTHALLTASGIKTPVIYVGHSIAGLYGVALQASHPEDVAAEVLVDPSFSNQAAAMSAALPPAKADAMFKTQSQQIEDQRACLELAKTGALAAPKTKAAKDCVSLDGIPYPLDDRLKRTLRHQISGPAYLSANLSEVISFAADVRMSSIDGKEVEAAKPRFGDKPLIILTHGASWSFPGLTPAQNIALDATWRSGHDTLATLSTRGSNTVVPGASHYIQIDEPKAVIAAVLSAVADVHVATK